MTPHLALPSFNFVLARSAAELAMEPPCAGALSLDARGPRIANSVGQFAAMAYYKSMSPTVFREGPFRFYFFSREESRMHVHVQAPDGEAKFWLEPKIELAMNVGLPEHRVNAALVLVKEHEDEIRTAWNTHFRR